MLSRKDFFFFGFILVVAGLVRIHGDLTRNGNGNLVHEQMEQGGKQTRTLSSGDSVNSPQALGAADAVADKKTPFAQTLSPLAPVPAALADLIAHGPYAGGDPTTDAKMDEALQTLFENPDAFAKELKRLLPSFTPEQEPARRFLLQQLARAQTDTNTKIDILLAELKRSPDRHLGDDTLGPAILFDSLMEITEDPRILKEGLETVFKHTPGRLAREAVWTRFSARYPEDARRIHEELTR